MADQLSQSGEMPPFPRMRPRSIHIITNPAAGQDRPFLNVFNKTFQEAGIDWELLITKKPGDAARFAQDAVKAGVDVVAAYGGDGTVGEVAGALHGTNQPLAILPGGTANVMSVELGIPGDLPGAL